MKKHFINGILTAGVILVLAVTGCKSNPYPDGQITKQQQTQLVVQKNFVIDAPKTVKIAEGIKAEFLVRGTVPPPGTPIFTFDGLPKGAVYSAADQKVTWTPDYEASHDPNNPRATTRTYEINVTMQSSTDSVTVVNQPIVITVTKASRPFTVANFRGDENLSEGNPFYAQATIQNDEYPQGPFTISESGAPAGVNLVIDPAHREQLNINFTPGFGLVDSVFTQQSGYYQGKEFKWTLYVSDPGGKVLAIPVSWHITDSRQDPTYVGVKTFSSSSQDVSLVVVARDPNMEVEPTITVLPPDIGTITPSRLDGNGPGNGIMPSQTLHIRWSGIPITAAGKTYPLSLHICVYDRNHNMNQCTEQLVDVTFTFAAPTPTPVPSPVPPPPPPAPVNPAPTGGQS